jgi:hypothetical protein
MHRTKVKTRLLPSLSLLILLLAACAPAAVSPEPSDGQPAAPVAVDPTATAFIPVDPAPVDPATDVAAAPTEAAPPVPVATSRGPNLEATDPSTVNLASGDLQFVEFFRFT